MVDDINPNTCRKPDCQVTSTGSCAEGHTPLASCPNFGEQVVGRSDIYDGELEPSAEPMAPDVARVSLPSGEALTQDEVEQFLRWRPATFVTVIGDSHSGKTTLICALYERFLKGYFAGFGFAGSRTLVALERRSHHSRVDSGRVTPETARTSHFEGLHYFHFAIAPEGHSDRRVDLLLSDRAGEIYQTARNNSDIVRTLPEIPQSHRIVLLLDGRRVADPIERAGATQAVRQTLRVFLDNGALGLMSIVQIVTTKIDLIEAAQDRQRINNVLSAFRDRLTSDFALRLKSLSFHEISARDPKNHFAPAYGLDALVEDWATYRLRHAPPPLPEITLHSEFDRLILRTPLEVSP